MNKYYSTFFVSFFNELNAFFEVIADIFLWSIIDCNELVLFLCGVLVSGKKFILTAALNLTSENSMAIVSM